MIALSTSLAPTEIAELRFLIILIGTRPFYQHFHNGEMSFLFLTIYCISEPDVSFHALLMGIIQSMDTHAKGFTQARDETQRQ